MTCIPVTCVAPAGHPRALRPFRLRRRSAPAAGPRDPHERLLRCLLALAGPNACIESAASRPWASATFLGSRHEVALHFSGEDARADMAAMAEQLPEADFAIPGHIVADIGIEVREWRHGADGRPYGALGLSALVIEDW